MIQREHASGSSAQAPSPTRHATPLEARRRHYIPNAALNYDNPIHMVRGEGCYLIAADGSRYLDAVNNVAHVGHCHPQVAEAVCAQMRTLNTNSRYLSDGLNSYVEQLLATFPAPLDTAALVCSGSEANDLALRLASSAAAATAAAAGAAHDPHAPLHVAVMGGAYHGHLASTLALSPYKFFGSGGSGRAPHVHVLPCPDPYRGRNLDGRAAARAAISQAAQAGGTIAAFISESVLSCGGQIVLPPGYLAGVYDEMRAVGAVVIADEVQVGFGRCGVAMWAFETQGVVPDIVTLGKPIGNGFPMGATVTTRALASTFAAGGMEFFATFGGCNAACAAGAAVLCVLAEEQLQQRAATVGAHLLSRLRQLQHDFPGVVGDVRGMGLMVGVEVVQDPGSKTPAPAAARWVKERAKERHRVLLSTDGPYDNVIKMKPPLVFGVEEAEAVAAALRECLGALVLEPEGLVAAEEAAARTYVAPRAAAYAANERQMAEALAAARQQEQRRQASDGGGGSGAAAPAGGVGGGRAGGAAAALAAGASAGGITAAAASRGAPAWSRL